MPESADRLRQLPLEEPEAEITNFSRVERFMDRHKVALGSIGRAVLLPIAGGLVGLVVASYLFQDAEARVFFAVIGCGVGKFVDRITSC